VSSIVSFPVKETVAKENFPPLALATELTVAYL
jgi:hypothetical protein